MIALRLLVIMFAVIISIPLLLTITASFDDLRTPKVPPRLIPHFTLANYARMMRENPVGLWMFNSVFLATATGGISTALSLAAGFGFEKKVFPGRELLYVIVLISMTIPATMLILPKFLMVKRLGLYNTRLGLILPFATSAGMIFFARNYFRGFPDEYLDEAEIMGSGELSTFTRIVLPISGPVVALASIGTFLGAYHNYMWQLVMIKNNRLLTIVLGIQEAVQRYLIFQADGRPAYSLSAAGTVLAFLPVVVLFCIFQKRFIGGFYGSKS